VYNYRLVKWELLTPMHLQKAVKFPSSTLVGDWYTFSKIRRRLEVTNNIIYSYYTFIPGIDEEFRTP
jgi:hypothetical protein